jgi:DNA-binding XRE family transcriptional regulator
MASSAEVLCPRAETFTRSLFGRPTSGSYRAAVSQIIREVKAKHKLSNERLAELIGCSEQTIANAEGDRAENNLNAVTLLSIAYAFGEEAIEPVRSLYLCAPAEQPNADTRLNRIEREINALRKELES